MMIKVITAILLLACGTASANHKVIRGPDGHSDRQTRHTRHRDNGQRFNGLFITPYAALGIGSGGDEIGQFTDSDGFRDSVRSGGGFLVEGGLLLAVDRYTRLRLTGGYEVDSVSRFNGRSTFDRFRFDLMLLRNFGAQELGVGLTGHTGVGFRCEINSVCAGDVDFDDALGYTIEYALTTFNQFGRRYDRRLNPLRDARLGIRFTDIDYRPQILSAPNASEVDGKSLSLFLGFAW